MILGRQIMPKPWVHEEEQRKTAANLPLYWTDGRTTRSTELLNWCTVPYKQRNRHENTLFMRGVDSNKQAGPLCQRPDYKSSANALVSIQRRSTSYSIENADKAKRHTGSSSPTTFRRLSFNWKTYFRHLHPQHGRKAQRGGALHLGTINGKNGTLKDDKTKNGGISDNPDNAIVTHKLVQGDLFGDVRARRSQLLSSSPESGFHS